MKEIGRRSREGEKKWKRGKGKKKAGVRRWRKNKEVERS